MNIIRSIINVLFISLVGFVLTVADFICYFLYLIFVQPFNGWEEFFVSIVFLFSAGPLFILYEIIVDSLLKRNNELNNMVRNRLLIISIIVHTMLMIFVFPLTFSFGFMNEIVWRAHDEGGISLLFYQISSCLGAGICFIGCTFRSEYGEKTWRSR